MRDVFEKYIGPADTTTPVDENEVSIVSPDRMLQQIEELDNLLQQRVKEHRANLEKFKILIAEYQKIQSLWLTYRCVQGAKELIRQDEMSTDIAGRIVQLSKNFKEDDYRRDTPEFRVHIQHAAEVIEQSRTLVSNAKSQVKALEEMLEKLAPKGSIVRMALEIGNLAFEKYQSYVRRE